MVRPVRSMLDFSSSIIFYCFTSAFVVVLSFGENQTSNLQTLGAVAIRQRTGHICEQKKNISCLLDSVRLIAFGCVRDNCVGETFFVLFFKCVVAFYFFLFTILTIFVYIVLCSASIDEALELFINKIATPEGDRSVFFFFTSVEK